MVSKVCTAELQLHIANPVDTDTFLDLELSISNGKILYKIYDKRIDFNFELVSVTSS